MRHVRLVFAIMFLITSIASVAVMCIAGNVEKVAPEPGDSLESQLRVIKSSIGAHGFPFDDAASLPIGAQKELQEALADSTQKASWPNILTAVGIMGGAASHQLLHNFVWNRFHDEIDAATFRAMMTAVDALGWDQRGPSREAIQELELGTNPQTWGHLPWTYTIEGSRTAAWLILSKVAINGLSYSGTDQAESTLTRLANKPYHVRQLPNIKEGLERNKAIKRRGIRDVWMKGKAP